MIDRARACLAECRTARLGGVRHGVTSVRAGGVANRHPRASLGLGSAGRLRRHRAGDRPACTGSAPCRPRRSTLDHRRLDVSGTARLRLSHRSDRSDGSQLDRAEAHDRGLRVVRRSALRRDPRPHPRRAVPRDRISAGDLHESWSVRQPGVRDDLQSALHERSPHRDLHRTRRRSQLDSAFM